MAERRDDDERPLPALRLAESLEGQRHDELIAIDRVGGVISRRQVRRRLAMYYGLLGVASAGAFWVSLPFGAIYSGLLGAMVWRRRRVQARLNRVTVLLRADRLDEVEREIAAVERGPARYRPLAMYARAAVAARRGQLDAAIAACAQCAAMMPSADGRLSAIYWANQFVWAGLLLEQRKLAEAQPVIDRAMKAPGGEIFVMFKRGLEAQRAFVFERDEDLGDDLALHDRAREALRYNQTGMTVAILAWAFERRGEAEMSAHLLGEVAARCPHGVETFARTHPRLWAWLEPKLAALPAADEAIED